MLSLSLHRLTWQPLNVCMVWNDIACIVFICTCMNHLGLIGAIEDVIKHPLPIVNCVKCSSFWCTLSYCFWCGCHPITMLAISFLASYSAIWLELAMGIIDFLYSTAYGKIYSTTDNDKDSANTYNGDTTN